MKASARLGLAVLIVSVGLSGGCTQLWIDTGPKIRVNGEESLTLPADEVGRVDVKTHNGRVSINGQTDGAIEFVVQVKKQARAHTLEEAHACMEAIEIVTDRDGDTQRIGWRWNPIRKHGWSASVQFDVEAPANVAMRVETHNGGVDIEGMTGDCDLETHNGSVTVKSASNKIVALTHNGGVKVTAPAEELRLETHNGRVRADLTGAHNVSGRLVTHNGGVTVVMDQQAAANLNCRTHNGSISSSLKLDDVNISRSRLRGRIGDAKGEMHVETHNGSIVLK